MQNNRWALVPNALTALRLVAAFTLLMMAVVVFFVHALVGVYALWAWPIFVLGSITDGLDGYVARKYNAISKWGAVWDPHADKALVLSYGLFLIAAWIGNEPLWPWGMWAEYVFLALIFSREVVILTLRGIYGHDAMPVQVSGKMKAVLQGTALGIYGLMLFTSTHVIVHATALIVLFAATFLAWYSAGELISALCSSRKGVTESESRAD